VSDNNFGTLSSQAMHHRKMVSIPTSPIYLSSATILPWENVKS